MRVAFANAAFKKNSHEGPNAHVRQWVTNAAALGHEVWMWPDRAHPAAKELARGRLERIRQIRAADVLYVRVEHKVPTACTWARGPQRAIVGNPLMVWEFNTTPEFGLYRGSSEADVKRTIDGFRFFGKGCDLGVCVSQHLADYVKEKLGLRHVLAVPNGSDPDLYRPDAPVVPRLANHDPSQLNVVWIGSAYVDWHNFGLLADAAKLVWERGGGDKIVFHLIGAGMNCMRDMPPNVHYYGVEHYELLPQWLAGMDVGLCLYKPGPADYSSPLKVFDYMSSGLAVVATAQPQVRQIFGELGQEDLLMSPDDPVRLADTVWALSQDRARVKALGEKSRKLLIERYTWRRAVADTFAEIERLRRR